MFLKRQSFSDLWKRKIVKGYLPLPQVAHINTQPSFGFHSFLWETHSKSVLGTKVFGKHAMDVYKGVCRPQMEPQAIAMTFLKLKPIKSPK